MAIKAKCLLCAEKEIETEVSSNVIAKSKEEAAQLLGLELVKHIMGAHPDRLGQQATGRVDRATGAVEIAMGGEVVVLAGVMNGFLITRFFESEDRDFEEQKEEIRDKLCEAIMWGSRDEEFEDEDEPGVARGAGRGQE